MAKKHSLEMNPPCQEKYPRQEGDFNLKTTALPVDNRKVSSRASDVNAGSLNDAGYMRPVTDDQRSFAITNFQKSRKKG